jgi:hypothetical protein
MTPLEELIEGASGDSVPVATLLRKVKVVAARLGTVELEQWVDHELTGYPENADVPDYRAARPTEVKGHFGGPAGSGLQNAVIPRINFPAKFRDGPLFNMSFRQPISELERMAQADQILHADWPGDAVVLTNQLLGTGEVQLYEYMGLQQAFRLISPHHVAALVDTVRTRILTLVLSLESVVPAAGQPNAPVADSARVDRLVMNIFGGSPNVAVASTNFRQQAVSMPPIGDRDGLFGALEALGIEALDLDALRTAIHKDEDSGDGVPGRSIGLRVRAWAGGLALKGSSAAGKGAATAAGAMALKALASYYGVDLN